MVPRLQEHYKNEVAPGLAKDLSMANPMRVPRLQKITISMGMGQTAREQPRLDAALKELTAISAQKPLVSRAKKSVSNFKLREGMNVGLKVTLRRARMWEFLDRLINLALPRVKDFRGLNPNGFDGRGNYNMGLTEQTLFPEINPDKVQFTQGMNIAITTSAQTDEEARELLTRLGMPFRRPEN